MGRPPLFLIRLHVSLTADALNRMDKIVGPKGRAKFVREAVEQRLDNIEKARKLDAATGPKSE